MNNLRFRCLVIDHDDTSVNSTPSIHYPAFLEAMKMMRPGYEGISLEDYFIKNFDPGFGDFLKKELGFSDREMLEEFKVWRSFTERMTPEFFPGFLEMLEEFKISGGYVAVVSHSEKEIIERDYTRNTSFKPDIVFGWDHDHEKRKPHPYPVKEIMKYFGLKKEDVLVLDDLKTGLIMARKAGVKFAAAGWAYDIKYIRDFMKAESDYYFYSINELADFLFYKWISR